MPITDREGWEHLLLAQEGVLSRRQFAKLGLLPHELQRMLRRREVVRVHRVEGLEKMTDWHRGPPRVRFEDNELEMVHRPPRRSTRSHC